MLTKEKLSAPISQIFVSLQGEGIYIGQEHLFIRFSGCNLSCEYCDTKDLVPEILTADSVVNRADSLSSNFNNKNGVRVVALTGGEPLLYPEFIKNLAGFLKDRGHTILLETNGTLSEHLSYVKDFVDIVSMDIKMPCSHASMDKTWQDHRVFLDSIKDKEVYVKVVVQDRSLESDFLEAVNMVSQINNEIPFVIQPVTVDNKICQNAFKKSLNFLKIAQGKLKDVRVIPQMHILLGIN